MAPFTTTKPKPLVLFKGKPLICWTIDAVYQHVHKVVVVTKPFADQFEDLRPSYPKVRLVRSDAETMLGNFSHGFACTDADYIFCGSSDVAYNASAVEQTLGVLNQATDDVIVALKNGYSGSEKRWAWHFDGDRLTDISRGEDRTSYERFFFLCKRKTLTEFLSQFASASSSSETDPQNANEFGSGWIYLLKTLARSGASVRTLMLDDQFLHNVNRPGDLQPRFE